MGDADGERALRLAAVARKWLEDPRVGYSGDLSPVASDSERQALSSMVMAGARVSVAEPGRVVCSLRVRAPLTDRGDRGGCGQRVLGGGVHGGGRAHGHRPVQHVLLLARPCRRAPA
ncbi:unnamed protein product [Urochloa humidicola]